MIKSYCLHCEQEQVIIIDQTIIARKKIKYEGKCSVCGEYCCRVVGK